MIGKLVLVALGGACGASLRYLCTTAALRIAGDTAWGTLFVNVVGSLVMGVAAILLVERFTEIGPRLMPLITVGLLGGFTTFSAFSLDAVRLFEDGRIGVAAGYVLGSVVLSILALFAGLLLGRALI
ncbi:MAG: fluoride efflux transporter CrcB [Pseudomonadota bacterium]